MTYTELKTKIANFLNRSDLTNEMDNYIQLTESEVNRKLRHKDMIKRATATLETQYSQLPGDFIGIVNVDLLTADPKPMFQQSLESLDVFRKSIDNSTGEPKYYAISGDTLEVAPNPSSAYTIQMTYYAEIPGLSSSNATNFLSTSAPDVYLYGCLKHASIFLMEDERLPLISTQFEKALEELKIQQQQGAFGKGSLLPRKRTYGRARQKNYYYQT